MKVKTLFASMATDTGCRAKAVMRAATLLTDTSLDPVTHPLSELHGGDRSRAHTLGTGVTSAVIAAHGVLLGPLMN